jgi:hypothetical protein
MRQALALTLSCLAISACGGDGDGNGGGSQLQRAIEPEAQERAESMLLTLSDFPDGWRADAPEEEDEDSSEGFRECAGADYSALTIVGEARSDDFAMGSTAQASSQAEVFESEEMAAAAVAEFTQAFASDEASACMNDYLGNLGDAEVEFTGAELGELSFTPPSGVDDASAWQVAVTVTGKPGTQAAGASVDAYIDFIQLREGERTAEVTTLDILSPFDPELRDDLVAAVAGRMADE